MIDNNDIFSFVAKILNETFEIPLEEINLESELLEDLDLDSIDAVDLIVQLQKHTTKNIDPAEFRQVRTVGDVVKAVESVAADSDLSGV